MLSLDRLLLWLLPYILFILFFFILLHSSDIAILTFPVLAPHTDWFSNKITLLPLSVHYILLDSYWL